MNIPEPNGQRRITPNEVAKIDQAASAKESLSSKQTGYTSAAGYQPDSKISKLQSKLKVSDSVRADVVDEARRQIESGELLNREAARETAASIVGIVQHF